jgi:hypothetical protein
MSLAILCPSRSRPDRCRKMIDSALETTSETEVLIYVDRDDPYLGDYLALVKHRVKVMVGDHIGRGPAINELVKKADRYDNYLIVSDDITYVRPGWDVEVREAMDSFGDGIGCVHLASENGQKYVNWLCVSRKWIETLGWINEPTLDMFCQDTVVSVLAEALGRIKIIEPQVVQHECLVGAHQMEKFSRDAGLFLWYCASRFGSDLAKLKAVMK